MKEIEIPFGAKDSELKGWEYTIPEGMEAEIKDGKIVVKKKQPEPTEFERELALVISTWMKSTETKIPKYVSEHSPRLLELAKKEICKGCTVAIDSYIKGRDDERKTQDDSKTFHYDTYQPPCRYGGICISPFKDCINCPRTGGYIGISTTSGTCKKD